ncbi:MAG: OmpA family protein [Ignavibacteria bacterium]
MKRNTVVTKNFQGSKGDTEFDQKETGYRYLLWLFIAVVVISLISLVSSVYSDNSAFGNYLDSVNNSDVIYFDYGRYELKENSFEVIDRIAEQMKSNENIILNITGYTDSKGSERFNHKLSIMRANAVREYLILKGIDGSKIIASGKGENEPVNDNSTDIMRTVNRRVEFSISNLTASRNQGRNAKENSKERRFYADGTLKNQYVNSRFTVKSREEITADLSIRDSAGLPVDSVNVNDISANLKWDNNGKIDSTEGFLRLMPINDKKKIAFTLTMDYSGSMYGTESNDVLVPKSDKIIAMEKSVKVFIDQLGSNMYCKIIKFGEKVLNPIRFTKSKNVLYSVLENNSYPMGGTALFSSIYTALSDTAFQSNPTVMKTIIAFTDGMENSSVRLTIDSIFNKSLLTNTKIFTVGLYNDVGNYKPSEDELVRRKIDMLKIAQNTGGFFYQVNDPDKLNEIYKNIFNQVMKSFNISIVWNSDKLPPKGTQVKAELKINVKGHTRVIYTNYVME